MWKNELIDIGIVAENTNHEIIFEFTGKCTPVNVEVYPSCGCTSAAWDEGKKQLIIKLTIGTIPQHLPHLQVGINKSIKMNYLCTAEPYSDMLTIIGMISKLS